MSRSAVEFIKTPHCRRGAHCGRCRDLEGGRVWRQDKMKGYGAPEVDWPCPKGHEWGYEPPEREGVKRGPEPPFVSARRAACDACNVPAEKCEVAYKRALQESREKGCWFRRFILAKKSKCPQGRWKR